jgi:hypothetical protein
MSPLQTPITHSLHHYELENASFNDVLAHQMRKAPYLLASIMVHTLIAFFIAGYLLLEDRETETPVIQMEAVAAIPEVEVPPEPDLIEPILDPIVEPVLVDTPIDTPTEDQTLEVTGDIDSTSDASFDHDSWSNALGLGPGAGGKFGKRGDGGGKGYGSPTEKSVQAGLQWLRDHQSPDGYWDSDAFMDYDQYPDQPASDGPGDAVNDVGATGLALLAFLGNGHSTARGMYQTQVTNGIRWLRDVQDMSTGLFGEEVGNPTMYNHSIATLAMGEAQYMSKSILRRKNLVKATSLILNSQNPYGAWRYSMNPSGDNDTSLTGWMVFALKSAEESGVGVPRDSYAGAKEWFNTMTDPGTGRTGYAFGDGGGAGGRPSRIKIYLEKFPPEKSEALTAVALLCRLFMTDANKVKKWSDHPEYAMLKKQANLISQTQPVWDEEGGSCDMYYWYYGTFAMNQWGGKHWQTWKKSIEKALIPNQRLVKGNFYGSWDPVGPWGEDGGRVYSTAICTLILEVYYRYARVLGAR